MSIVLLTDCSFVVWRVHLERMARLKNAARREIEEDGVEVAEVPLGRTFFSAPTESEKLDLFSLDSVDEHPHFKKAIPTTPSPRAPPPPPPSPSPAPSTESLPPLPTPPSPPPYFQPNPAFYPKYAPRFYSVVWTGGHNTGINGEYLLPDLDYPGRVLLSESTFQAWRKQNL